MGRATDLNTYKIIFSDTEQLKKSYTSQIESMKETLKFRISSLENENSELQVGQSMDVVTYIRYCDDIVWAVKGW